MGKQDKVDNRSSGQSMVVLVSIMSLLILFTVGLFSYEVNRVELCRVQLRSATEAAALAAAATLASQDNQDPSHAHAQAIMTALSTFQKNSVAGCSLLDATLSSFGDDQPPANKATLFVEFLDPNNNNEVVSNGNPAGKIARVTSSIGLLPSFGNFLGLSNLPLRSTVLGGVPDLDVVLCFDVSGSIDDQTPVSFVRRRWSGSASAGHIDYIVPDAGAGSAAGALAQGRLYDVIGPPATGTRVQALPPQYLGLADSNTRWPLDFAPPLRSSAPASSDSTNNELAGYPPGNKSQSINITSSMFTDLVVNIDGNTTFQGLNTADGYAFPDLATLVEASRGNLEDAIVFHASGADTGVPSSIVPKLGYKAKYLELARANCRPIKDAQDAAATFFTIMNTNTVGHFSIVCFSDDGSGSPVNAWRVDSSYTPCGILSFDKPLIALDPGIGSTNFSAIMNALPNTTALQGTNIGDAINTAVNQLSNNARQGSKKAIVLFTDGQPTVGGPLHSDPWTNARRAALRAKQAGIPIYSIGLAQNSEIIPNEVAILTDQNSDPGSGGVSGIAGHGGKFFLVTNVSSLRLTFENIARQLVQLVR